MRSRPVHPLIRQLLSQGTALTLLVAGLGGCSPGIASTFPADAAAPADASATPPEGRAEHAELVGVEHYRRWSEHVGQGGQPLGEEAFAALAKEGFTTLVSVDGALPDVETAGKYGLRYVHVPIGYDGVEPDEKVRIVKAVQESLGPVFIHCHHGLHRGPAATAIARIVSDGITPEEAQVGLKDSGCNPSYAGLFDDVLSFQAPDPAEIAALPPLPSQVLPEGVRGSMVVVDEYWELVTAVKDAGWATPANHPDVVPALQTRMLAEQLRELGRIAEARALGDEFLTFLAQAEEATSHLATLIEQGRADDAVKGYDAVKQSCKACHASYRD